jgi:hypothetical protein
MVKIKLERVALQKKPPKMKKIFLSLFIKIEKN